MYRLLDQSESRKDVGSDNFSVRHVDEIGGRRVEKRVVGLTLLEDRGLLEERARS